MRDSKQIALRLPLHLLARVDAFALEMALQREPGDTLPLRSDAVRVLLCTALDALEKVSKSA